MCVSSSDLGAGGFLFVFVESFALVESFAARFVVSLGEAALSALAVESSTSFAGSTMEPATALTKSSIVTWSRARSTATTGSTEAIWMILSASPSRVAVLLTIPSAGMASVRGK